MVFSCPKCICTKFCENRDNGSQDLQELCSRTDRQLNFLQGWDLSVSSSHARNLYYTKFCENRWSSSRDRKYVDIPTHIYIYNFSSFLIYCCVNYVIEIFLIYNAFIVLYCEVIKKMSMGLQNKSHGKIFWPEKNLNFLKLFTLILQ